MNYAKEIYYNCQHVSNQMILLHDAPLAYAMLLETCQFNTTMCVCIYVRGH